MTSFSVIMHSHIQAYAYRQDKIPYFAVSLMRYNSSYETAHGHYYCFADTQPGVECSIVSCMDVSAEVHLRHPNTLGCAVIKGSRSCHSSGTVDAAI